MATAPLLPDDVMPQQSYALSDEELVAILRREYNTADSYHDQLRLARHLNRRFYEADLLGNEMDGRSQIVLPDVQETIDYMVPSVLRTFLSGDNIVEFEATDEQFDAGAQEATQAINYSFMRQQDGYRILHDYATDGLIERTGILKTVSEDCQKIIVTHPFDTQGEEVGEVGDGSDELPMVKRRVTYKRFVDVPIPPERFRFSPLATHEDTADYLAHVEAKTRSDLVEMGFDRDQVYALPSFAYDRDDTRNTDRDNYGGGYLDANSSPALQKVLLCEEYARVDRDGDGVAERLKIFRVENEILIDAATGQPSIEEVEDQPFTVFCPYPRPHRLVGYSLAEKVMDLQVARSTIARQLFDGMYSANMPRPIVSIGGMSDNTIDDLLSPIPGSPIRVKDVTAVEPYVTTFDVGKSLQVLEWITGERESRTGITRLNQGLDADALNKTATGTAMMQASGQQQEDFVARNLAESMSRVFVKKYRLMRAEAEPFSVKVDGNYVKVDPANWPEEVNVVVRVGLGTGSKDKRIQYRMSMVPLMAEGFVQGVVTPQNTFKMIDGLVRDMGLGTGDDYWLDPDSPEGQQQLAQIGQSKPDPAMLKAQADAQAQQQKADMALQESQQQIALSQNESEARLSIMHNEGQQKIELEASKAQQHQNLAEQKAQFEADLARQTADRNYELAVMQEANRHALAVHQADHSHELAKQQAARVPQERPGGALDK